MRTLLSRRDFHKNLGRRRRSAVIGWHRQVFRLFWTKLLRRKKGGRPAVDPKVRALIK